MRHRDVGAGSALGIRDLLDEALAGLLSRPGRMVVTGLGTILGVTALVTIAGLTTTAGDHIVARFDALAATEVVIAPTSPEEVAQGLKPGLPDDAEERLADIDGVLAAGASTPIDVPDASIHAGRAPIASADLVAASPGLVDAVLGVVAPGRWFDGGHVARRHRVAVVGVTAAERLDLGPLRMRPAVFVNDVPFTVIGVLRDVERLPNLLDAVVVPPTTARDVFGALDPGTIHVHTELGAAEVVAAQSALALVPNAPESIEVRVAPAPAATRASIAHDVRTLLVVLGGVALIGGGLGIANTTMVSVMERRTEIGLRRSIGAYRRHVAAQFLVESLLVGLVGALLGTACGIVVVVVVSAFNGWAPVVDTWVLVAAPAGGAVVGLLAGTYPAWRSAAIQPLDALRS